jgi:high-affinity Fe2+/Pb2+ permease
LRWSHYANLLPATGPRLLPLTGQVLPLTSYFGELVLMPAFCAYLQTPRRLVQAAAWALVLVVFLMVFTLPAGLAVPFPFFEMTQLVMGRRFCP